jgi:pimeloyl-ACP methyl ester carboxylesterase
MTEEREDDGVIRPLARLAGARPPAPDWFGEALAAPSDEGSVEVSGARIRYSAWGETSRRGLVFVHGGRAHRNWWRPFAPFFADRFRVVAYDISGMGDSDWRERYSLNCAIDELFAVARAAGATNAGRPIVVGHSFGGWMTLAAVEREGEHLSGAVVVDSPIGLPDPDEGYTVVRAKADGEPVRSNRIYPSLEEPVARFRFLPNQPCESLYLVDYIAREGLKPATGSDGRSGWTWKFDPGQGRNFDIHFDRDLFLAPRCPLAFLYGEKSMFAQGDGIEHLKRQARGRSPVIMMPAVHHHLMMEEPIAFITTLRALLTTWPIRVGH